MDARVIVSEKLRKAIRVSDVPLYRLALACDLPPSTLYKAVRGIVAVRKDDNRIVRLGKLLSVRPSECFEVEEAGK